MKITSASFVIFIQMSFLSLTALAQGDSLKNSKKDYSKIFKNSTYWKDGRLYGDTVIFLTNCHDGGSLCTCVKTYRYSKVVKSKCYRNGNLVSRQRNKFIPLLLHKGEKTKTWDEKGRKQSWSVSVVRVKGKTNGHWPSNRKRISVSWEHERGKWIKRSRKVTKADPY